MPPDPPSKSPLRRSKWALSRPYCQYPELCHARAYKQKKARNAPESHLKLDLDKLKIAVNKYEDEIRTRGVPGKLVMLFSAFGHNVLSAMNYSNPFLSPKRTLLIGTVSIYLKIAVFLNHNGDFQE